MGVCNPIVLLGDWVVTATDSVLSFDKCQVGLFLVHVSLVPQNKPLLVRFLVPPTVCIGIGRRTKERKERNQVTSSGNQGGATPAAIFVNRHLSTCCLVVDGLLFLIDLIVALVLAFLGLGDDGLIVPQVVVMISLLCCFDVAHGRHSYPVNKPMNKARNALFFYFGPAINFACTVPPCLMLSPAGSSRWPVSCANPKRLPPPSDETFFTVLSYH